MKYCKCGCGEPINEDKEYLRGHATRLQPEILDQYDSLFELGLTFQEVGDKMGVSRQQAHNVYKRYFSDKYHEGRMRRTLVNTYEKTLDLLEEKNWPNQILKLRDYLQGFGSVVPVVKTNRLSKIEFMLDGTICKLIYSERIAPYMAFQIRHPEQYNQICVVWNPSGHEDTFAYSLVFLFPSNIIEPGKQYYIASGPRGENSHGVEPKIDFYQYQV